MESSLLKFSLFSWDVGRGCNWIREAWADRYGVREIITSVGRPKTIIIPIEKGSDTFRYEIDAGDVVQRQQC